MKIGCTTKYQLLARQTECQRDIDLCKLKLKQKGLSDEKIGLLERNIRAIINDVLNNMENE